jgi:hypothetical protein
MLWVLIALLCLVPPLSLSVPLVRTTVDCPPNPALTLALEDRQARWRRGGPEEVDARSFGAVGDGTRDSLDALSRAIRALPAEGGIVRLPGSPQPYVLRDTLRIRRGNILLAGDGMGKSVLSLQDAVLSDRSFKPVVEFVAETRPVESVGVTDLTIDGNRRGNPVHSEFNPGLQFRTEGDQPLSGVAVTRVGIRNTAGDALTLRSNATGGSYLVGDVTIRDSVFEDPNERDAAGNARQGIAIIGATNVRIVSNRFERMPAAAVDLEPNPDRPQPITRVLVQQNRINATWEGVFVTSNLKSVIADVALVRNLITARSTAVRLRRRGAELRNVTLVANRLSAPVPLKMEGDVSQVVYCER